MKRRVLIMGAAGRDFHNFNVYFRGRPEYEVVAFTATQIPNIEGRLYPPVLAGHLYPQGIPIFPEEQLTKLIRKEKIDTVVFAYSDVAHEYVMEKASLAMAAGADFWLLGLQSTCLKANVPVVAVCAVRTGAGKSPTSQKVSRLLRKMGKKVVAIRHPMPYGNLSEEIAERLATYEDLNRYHCTLEEREEYEPYIEQGMVVYAGVDYEKILRQAEKEADIIIWDGGNNDLPFIQPDLHITVVDPLRPGHERRYHPGETNFICADVLVINKYGEAGHEQLQTVLENIRALNPEAQIVLGNSHLEVEEAETIRGKKVLVIEDGPTLTHGEMRFGAGCVAARLYQAEELVDPRPHAVGSIREAFQKYPHMENLVPALGYYPEQLSDLEKTINNTPADIVLIASPIDLRRVIRIHKKALRVRYTLQEEGAPDLGQVLRTKFLND